MPGGYVMNKKTYAITFINYTTKKVVMNEVGKGKSKKSGDDIAFLITGENVKPRFADFREGDFVGKVYTITESIS